MNLMSSMANTLVGSAMAIVRVAPERESGSTWYFRAVSAGMILMMAGSTSKWSRLIEGTPYWRESRLVISSSVTNPRLTKALPILPPFRFWWFSASWSCWGETMFSFSSSSPSLTGIPTLRQMLGSSISSGSLSASCEAASPECNVRADGVIRLTARVGCALPSVNCGGAGRRSGLRARPASPVRERHGLSS